MKNKSLLALCALAIVCAVYYVTQQEPASGKPAPVTVDSVSSENRAPSRSSSRSAVQQPSDADSSLTSTSVRDAAIALARDPDGNLPQGEPVLPAPADQVLDDPRDQGGIIIPLSNTGIYVPGEKAELSVTLSLIHI